jgi:hypothetical protein
MYKLARYNLATDLLDSQLEVPSRLLAQVKQAALIDPGDESIEGDWLLTADQVRAVGRILSTEVDPERYEYYLEPYFSAAAGRRRRHA